MFYRKRHKIYNNFFLIFIIGITIIIINRKHGFNKIKSKSVSLLIINTNKNSMETKRLSFLFYKKT
mgnify:CR=1 FL=1